MAIDIKGPDEIEAMRRTCLLAAATLRMVEPHLKPGISTGRINKLVHEYITDHGAYPSPLHYHGFPKSVCTSVNQVVCHGIPSDKQVLAEGDIINVDVTTLLDGFHGDCSATYGIGEVSADARRVTETSRECLRLGITQVRPEGRIRDIGNVISAHAEAQGCTVVEDYCGHGIGREFHADPQVPHYRFRGGPNPKMRPGMTFTVEPMINLGTYRVRRLDDGWTVVTVDGKWSAQFEHTVLVTESGVDVLTDPGKLRGTTFDR
jgi:methionyl aminopeptidase